MRSWAAAKLSGCCRAECVHVRCQCDWEVSAEIRCDYLWPYCMLTRGWLGLCAHMCAGGAGCPRNFLRGAAAVMPAPTLARLANTQRKPSEGGNRLGFKTLVARCLVTGRYSSTPVACSSCQQVRDPCCVGPPVACVVCSKQARKTFSKWFETII